MGASLPEVARRSCPEAQRQRGFCNASKAPAHGPEATAEALADERLRAALTPPARLALSGKLMGSARARIASC